MLPVVSAPADVLSRPAPVDPTDPAIVQLAADLVATMRVSPGCVGLAAPQVGVGAQVFVVDVTEHPKTATVARHVRAVQRPGGGGQPVAAGPRGLHVRAGPDRRREARRPRRGRGRPAGYGGAGRELATDAFEARALQHEIDHCAGKLFLDRVAGAHAIYQRKVYL